MSADEVRSPRSAVTEQRLAACAFRGSVRRNGVWKAVPMCAMNVNEREELYAAAIAERCQAGFAALSEKGHDQRRGGAVIKGVGRLGSEAEKTKLG